MLKFFINYDEALAISFTNLSYIRCSILSTHRNYKLLVHMEKVSSHVYA